MSMSVKDVVTKIEERLPKVWSEDWDNVGLIVGDPDRKVTKIAVALDATEQSVRNAVEFGCEMLVVHHPAIFRPLKRIVMPSPIAKMLDVAIRSDVAVYSSHTNWDSSPEGVNVILSNLLGLSDIAPIMSPHDGAWGMGAIGELSSPMTVRELARRAREAWGLSSLLIYGDDETPLRKVALCGGAGGDFLPVIIDRGSDVFITADVSYHYLLHAQLASTHLIVVNHGEMERASLPGLCRILEEITSLEVLLLKSVNWTPLII